MRLPHAAQVTAVLRQPHVICHFGCTSGPVWFPTSALEGPARRGRVLSIGKTVVAEPARTASYSSCCCCQLARLCGAHLKVCMVEDIERFSPELQMQSVGDSEFLKTEVAAAQ